MEKYAAHAKGWGYNACSTNVASYPPQELRMTRMQPPSSVDGDFARSLLMNAQPSSPWSWRHISALGAHGTTFNGLAKCSDDPSLGWGLCGGGDTEALGELSSLTAFVSGANVHACTF